jgi:Amt family ammonium transporter
MWIKYGKPDASMCGNGLLAGLVAITAPSGYVNTLGAVIIGFAAGLLVCLSVEFIDRVIRVDDPVGAISVHGACGLWGVISVGLFADGTNGVKGLFYGDATQLVAQLIGVGTLLGFVFTFSYVANLAIHAIVGQRVSAADELEGLDIPEMGALCYPEFVLKPDTTHSGAAAADFKTGLQVARETA